MDNRIVYCQNCRAANLLSDSHCSECGTRLLLVIFPSSLQYDTNQTPTYYEDHLLERVSILELRQAQLSEALRGMTEILRDQNAAIREERDLIRTLMGLLKDQNRDVDPSPGIIPEKVSTIKEEGDSLMRLVADCRKLIGENNERRAFQMLESARAVSPANLSLMAFYARELCRAERFKKAAEVADDGLKAASDDTGLLLISGAANAEIANLEQSRRSLGILARDGRESGIVNLVWGIISAYAGNWSECIAALKECSGKIAHPEIDYLSGCAYYQLGRYQMSGRHLSAAARAVPDFADAWFMLHVVQLLRNDPRKAEDSLRKAEDSGERDAQCAAFLTSRREYRSEFALPFRHFAERRKFVLSGGSTRIRRVVRNELEKALDSVRSWL